MRDQATLATGRCRADRRCFAGEVLLLGLLISVFVPVPTAAHPISISRASVYLTRQRATVEIEIFIEDLYFFHQLAANHADVLERSVLRRGIRLHEDFLRQRFQITDVSGRRLQPLSVLAAGVQLPAQGVPLAELMAHRVVFQLEYEFATPPEALTFMQRFTDEEAVLPSEMQLQVQQAGGGALVDRMLVSGQPHAQRIDWNNPPLPHSASEREREEWKRRQQQTLLGITQQGNVYSFLYVDDFEIRHEILVPIMKLAADLDIGLKPDAVLDENDQADLCAKVKDYYLTGNPLLVDGREVMPAATRCQLFGLDVKDFAVTGQPRPVPVAGARAGVILSYHLRHRARNVQLMWDRFNREILGVTAIVISGNRLDRKQLTRLGNRNVIQWQRHAMDDLPSTLNAVKATTSQPPPILIPWLACLLTIACPAVAVASVKFRDRRLALLAGLAFLAALVAWPAQRLALPAVWRAASPLSDAEAIEVFRRVHANTYQSFSRRNEDSVYEALALSVDGPLLRQFYLQIRRGMTMENQGGPMARIDTVQLVDTRRVRQREVAPGTICLRCRWNVAGSIEHWGHLHQRTNQYEAQFRLSSEDGFWKLVEMDLRDERRLSMTTQLRGG